MDWHFEVDRVPMIAPKLRANVSQRFTLDIRSKLRLSESSPLHVPCFREGDRLRLYQGAVHWALHNGLPVAMECRALKSVNNGKLIFADYAEPLLLSSLRSGGLRPTPADWGWCLKLSQRRCLISERAWLLEQTQLLPARRWRASAEEQKNTEEQLQELLHEVRDWASADLLPMQALKAIRRWQARLRLLLPDQPSQTD